MPDITRTRERFEKDRFATVLCGIEPLTAEKGHAVCRMALTDNHRNAMGAVMGGAIYTLCDFAYAVASNGEGDTPSVTLSSSISFLAAPRGQTLLAEATCLKDGRRIGCYRVEVTDETGLAVAAALFDGCKLDH